jgi:hypothetical protein
MKNVVLVLGVFLAVIAAPAFGAIEYEFSQKSTTEDPLLPMTELTGKAVLDGLRTRVDFRGGSLYPAGTYAVSTDSRRVFFVDPKNKTYTEVNMAAPSTRLASSSIRIENFKSNLERLTDRQVIAGHETDHYRITIDYDISARMGRLTLKRHVTTIVESWNTNRYGDISPDFVTGGNTTTGNAQLDQFLAATRTPGFPLRQTITTKSRHDLPMTRTKRTCPNPADCWEPESPERTTVHEMWVTSIRETTGAGISFTVPPTYVRSDVTEAPRTAADVLSFEPQGQ